MKAILFDLSGVLIDPFDSWLIALNETLKKFGKRKLSKREYMKYLGYDERTFLRKFGLGDDAVKYMRERCVSNIKEIKVIPEARKVLESLRKKLKLGLTTNCDVDYVYKVLEYFDLKKYFDVIITDDDVEKGKPDPEMIIKACKLLGLDKRDVIVVGDEKNDILAGKSAGCIVVGLNIEGDFTIKRLSELEKLIELGRIYFIHPS